MKLYLLREKYIYMTLNKFRHQGSILRGICWSPKENEDKVIQVLQSLQ